MSERALATVQTIKALVPIDGADRIELATFESIGWQTVVKLGEFKPGDKCVFFEIDSLLPDHTAFAFLSGKSRLRTVKLRGALSQGLALPVDAFPELGDCLQHLYRDGADHTEELGVKQYVPIIRCCGGQNKMHGDFPTHLGVKKTDETRLQAMPGLLDELRGLSYYITLKCDGTSATFAIDKEKDEFLICSRNNILEAEGDSVYHRAAKRYELERRLRENPDIIIQGEVCGPGIQGNKMGLGDIDLFVFNAYNQATNQYYGLHDAIDACIALGLRCIYELERGASFAYTQDELLAMAEGLYGGTPNQREGIVVRPQEPVYSERLRGPLSFKVISNAFLLGNPEE